MVFLLIACSAEMSTSERSAYESDTSDSSDMGSSYDEPPQDDFTEEASWVKPKFTLILGVSAEGRLVHSEVSSQWTVLDQNTQPICTSDRAFQITELITLADTRLWINLQQLEATESDSACSFSFDSSFELGGVELLYESRASWGAIDWDGEELDPETDNVYSGLIRLADREEAFLFGVAGLDYLSEWSNPAIEDATLLADVDSIEQWSFYSAFALPLQ